MPYLFSGLVLSGALMLALSGKALLACVLFFLAVWILNWSRGRWEETDAASGLDVDGNDPYV